MQLSAAATLIATAAAVTAARPRVTGNVGRRRARTQLRDQIVVLRGLRCGQLQALILALEILQLALRQEVEDRAAVAVGVVDDVARRVLHSVARVTRLRRHVVAHALDAALGVTATFSGLHLHGVELLHQRGLLVAAGQLGLRKAVCHRHIGAVDKLRLLVKPVAKAVVHTVDFALDVGEVGRQHIAVDHAAGIASVVASAVAAPAAEREQEQNDKPPRAVTAKPKATAIGRLHRHRHHGSAAIGKRHSITPFTKF